MILSNFYRVLQLSIFLNSCRFRFCFRNYSNYLLIGLNIYLSTFNMIKLIFLQFLKVLPETQYIFNRQQNQLPKSLKTMAFVFQTQRKVNEVSKLTNPTGPGQYFYQENNRKSEHCAPFNSTAFRKTLFDQKPIVKAGPGQYDIGKNIVQPNIKTVSNSHSIIVKINSTGTSEFKSARQRFGRDQTEVPGPGAYSQEESRIQKRSSSMTSPSKSAASKLKAFTQSLKKYPTIPQKVRGLTDMKNQEDVPTEQKLGPCHYNPDKKTRLNLTSTVWGKDKTRRFSLDHASEMGPGKYQIDLSKLKQHEKNDQTSSNFKSATVRTYFQSLYFKTNLSKTARQKKINEFKTKDPAPGQYDVNKSSFQIKEKPFSFQFFGSTVQRFADDFSQAAQKPRSVSFYNIHSTIGKNNSFNKGNHGFNSEADRRAEFLSVKERQFVPGPGHYKEKIVVQKKLRGINPQKFGSTTTRPFHKKEELDEVGPGKYLNKQHDAQDEIMKNKFGQIKETTSNFRSSTGRNCFGSTKGDIPLGEYDVSYTDISKKMQKQKNYLQNLKKIEVQKAPFQSTHTRFPHYEKSPPKQKKPNVEDINKQHELKIKDQSEKVRSAIIQFNRTQLKQKEVKGYFGKSQRFGGFRKGAPGVGQYKVQSGFDRKTYNVKYTNQSK